jgi:predicted RNA binding protein YcfA (HicA-like mRNA interferase family)
MSAKKLIKKFMTDTKHITMDDCEGLLTSQGYDYHKSAGSHRVYHKKGSTPITVVSPKHTKFVKPGYVKMIIQKLKLEE